MPKTIQDLKEIFEAYEQVENQVTEHENQALKNMLVEDDPSFAKEYLSLLNENYQNEYTTRSEPNRQPPK